MHDRQYIDQLAEHDTSGDAVYANSAYMDKNRKLRLEAEGVFCGNSERRV